MRCCRARRMQQGTEIPLTAALQFALMGQSHAPNKCSHPTPQLTEAARVPDLGHEQERFALLGPAEVGTGYVQNVSSQVAYTLLSKTRALTMRFGMWIGLTWPIAGLCQGLVKTILASVLRSSWRACPSLLSGSCGFPLYLEFCP